MICRLVNNSKSTVLVQKNENIYTVNENETIQLDLNGKSLLRLMHTYKSRYCNVKKRIQKYLVAEAVLDTFVTVEPSDEIEACDIFINEIRESTLMPRNLYYNFFVPESTYSDLVYTVALPDYDDIRETVRKVNLSKKFKSAFLWAVFFVLINPIFIFGFIFNSHKLAFAVIILAFAGIVFTVSFLSGLLSKKSISNFGLADSDIGFEPQYIQSYFSAQDRDTYNQWKNQDFVNSKFYN